MAVKTKEHQPSEVLSLRDNAKNQLLEIKSVEEGISYLNRLKAIDVWVEAEKMDAELCNLVAEQKLRTQRILGELITESQRKGLLANKEKNLKKGPDLPNGNIGKGTIPELGISYKQSAAFQAIAGIPEDKFEEFIQEKKQAVREAAAELTTAGALRLAKSLISAEDQKPPSNQAPLSEVFNIDFSPEKLVKGLAQWINNHLSKDQKAELITLIYPH